MKTPVKSSKVKTHSRTINVPICHIKPRITQEEKVVCGCPLCDVTGTECIDCPECMSD